MRLLLAIIAATFAFSAVSVEAAPRKKRGETMVVKAKPRSFLDAGTQEVPGRYQNYSLGQTPLRPGDSIVPTGSHQLRLLPGPFGL